MPHALTKTVFYFDELSESAKETARDWWRNNAYEYDWYEFIFDDAKECLANCGLDIDKIYFSGFSSQGDGACFEGSWSAEKVNAKALKEHTPKDNRLHDLVDKFAIVAKEYPGSSISVKHSGHYYHEHCTYFSDFEVSENDPINDLDYGSPEYKEREELIILAEQDIIDHCRDAMIWIYHRLEQEYEYLNADPQVDESILANEYKFYENGKIAI